MKTYIVLILMSLLFFSSNSVSQSIGSAFNYQGELIDNGSPANGEYDITVKLFKTETGGSATEEEDFPNTPVENGLFSLEVDFGDVVYANMTQYYIEIELTPSAGGSTSVLAPRNKLLAVPHAVQAQYLAPGGANNGDILQFNSGDWGPASVDAISPWGINGNILSTPGRVGIGTSSPTDRLHVNTLVGEDALRIQVDNATKLRVFSNGGTSLGANNTNSTPDNGLYVSGDVKQSQSSNGMLKYMLVAQCDAFPTIEREYNGTPVAGTASITNSSPGVCVIDLPFNTSSSYISVSPLNDIVGVNKTGNCISSALSITCKFEESSTGNNVDVFFTLFVY